MLASIARLRRPVSDLLAFVCARRVAEENGGRGPVQHEMQCLRACPDEHTMYNQET
jgi:hypothetical protein